MKNCAFIAYLSPKHVSNAVNDLRIVFMGTPEFAVPSLQILVQNRFPVVAVVTAPDKPKGRGQRLEPSPVKEFAVENGIKCLQPTNLKSSDFLDELKNLQANVQVVVAFRMLPEVVWAMPSLGTFNLHASLLPQYRGAAPINWAIINGEKETGVTTFFLAQEIDTGKIIFQEKEEISDDDDAGSLYERLMLKGAGLVLKTTQAIKAGRVQTMPQPDSQNLRPAPKIFKETCQIDWNQGSVQVRNFVRGLSPYPAARTTLNGSEFKVFKVSAASGSTSAGPGEMASDGKDFLRVKTGDGWVSLDELQQEGKKRMPIKDFLRGNNLKTS
jgi:methionyl-tRNA formyltransferase